MDFPKKGTEVCITMKSGAVYRGIFQWFKAYGGGRIMLQDVKCCQRGNNSSWIVCPKRGMNRKIWVSKIAKIEESGPSN